MFFCLLSGLKIQPEHIELLDDFNENQSQLVSAKLSLKYFKKKYENLFFYHWRHFKTKMIGTSFV